MTYKPKIIFGYFFWFPCVLRILYLWCFIQRRYSMPVNRTIFSQILSYVSSYRFNQCVDRYNGNRGMKKFNCWKQFFCMCFAQLTYRESLRDIEVCLKSQSKKLYHIGIWRIDFEIDIGLRQWKQRLAHLRRFRSTSDRRSAQALCGRFRFPIGLGSYRLCPGLIDHWSVSVAFPLGEVPKA